MAGGIWEAIGAALQQGGHTYGTLTQQEHDNKVQQEQLRRQADAEAMQREQFAFNKAQALRENQQQEEQRKLKILTNAISNATPETQFSPEDLDFAKQQGLAGLLHVTPAQLASRSISGQMNAGAPTGNMPGQAPVGPAATGRLDMGNLRAGAPEAITREFTPEEQLKRSETSMLKSIYDGASGDGSQAGGGGITDTPANRIALSHAKVDPNKVFPKAGATSPNTDALIQTIMNDPTGEVYQKLPTALKKTLAEPLAKAGYKFEIHSDADEKKKQDMLSGLDDTLGTIGQLIDENGNLTGGAASLYGASMGGRFIPGSDAANAHALVNRLTGQQVLALMSALKAQSRTGATGFGQLSEKELALLQNSASMLNNRYISDAMAQQELGRIRTLLQKQKDSVANPRPMAGQGAGFNVDASSAQAPAAQAGAVKIFPASRLPAFAVSQGIKNPTPANLIQIQKQLEAEGWKVQ